MVKETNEFISDIFHEENIVKLNVGGKRYMTTRDTLCSKGENFFTSLLNNNIPSIKDDKGYRFIDRNGKLFYYILEFFRTGYIDIPDEDLIPGVFREADFYSIKNFEFQWVQQQLEIQNQLNLQNSNHQDVNGGSNSASSSNGESSSTQNNSNSPPPQRRNRNHQHNQNRVYNNDLLLRWSLVGMLEKILKI
ncbi:leucine-rich repeat-containing protein (LRR) [Tieghemostelium lacteum]|uniref:Leucine-rich repeat-containing protein (LRR) n=1 Tax=Tieghemostelium lacteum TaxID=361077 RepID=A0A151ZCY0_TIELA|nr:leucine-rich repeat-containing protein (LRR) [Tieghemostelium lacteum]|eukprot:KYQ91734.1 leucine-rich repeat-containing protein (LRR) [Tieghemostelium lacteum]